MAGPDLPSALSAQLTAEFPEEAVRLVRSADITRDGRYGVEWLVVTDQSVLVFCEQDDGYVVGFNQPLSKIEKVECAQLVGSAALRARVQGRLYHLVAYTNVFDAEFGQACDDINHYIEGTPPKPADPSRQRRVCEQCGRPIPRDLNKCPHCTDRRKALLAIFRFVHPFRRYLAGMVAAMLVGTLVALIPPYMNKVFIDRVFKLDPETHVYTYAAFLPLVVLSLIVSYALQLGCEGLHGWFGGQCGHRTTHAVRSAVYQKLQELSLAYFDRHQTGALMARVNQDTNELRQLLVDFIPVTLESAFTLLGIGAVLTWMSWKLTCFVLVPIALALIFLKRVFFRLHAHWHRVMHKRSRLSAFVNDSLSGARVVKAFGQEALEVGRFDRRSLDYRDAGVELETKWSLYHPTLGFLIYLGSATVWYGGGLLLFAGEIREPGSIFAFQAYLAMFYRPVFILTRMLQMVSSALTASERIFDIIDTEPAIRDVAEPTRLPTMQGAIEFREVSFGYHPFDPVIKELSIQIAPHEMIGLVGRSGAGKSTFINLLCRLYDVGQGQILIDGVDLRQIRYADLRRQIGIVLQETFLFTGSIYDNIAYARPEATRQEVILAAIAANAHEFILTKPDGYDTEVGERGGRLSGGEKQRIAIARAILRDARILILDEATSSVDTETEKKIQDALGVLTKDRTTIAIAHRLSTLRNCHRLLVIEDGRLVESGTHQELMAKQGVFYQLVETQKKTSEIIAVGGVSGRGGGGPENAAGGGRRGHP
jgi:ATP-binding cassette subfamily B protein